MEEKEKFDKSIILFDGICNFCNSSVNFIIRRDKDDYFRFASLQSETGINIHKKFNFDSSKHDSLILFANNNIYTKSDAVLLICKKLKGMWKLFYMFILIPRKLRDIVYDIIAKNRYKWFGKRESCRIPSPEEINKFVA